MFGGKATPGHTAAARSRHKSVLLLVIDGETSGFLVSYKIPFGEKLSLGFLIN